MFKMKKKTIVTYISSNLREEYICNITWMSFSSIPRTCSPNLRDNFAPLIVKKNCYLASYSVTDTQ